MAVAFTSATASSGKNGTAASFTFTSFAVSGTNPAVLVKVALYSPTATPKTVSSVGVSAGLSAASVTEIKTVQNDAGADGTFISIWKLVAPSGTGTITVTLSASCPYQAVAELYSGCDQTDPSPLADAVTATGNTPNPLTVTPTNLTADDAASGFAANGGNGDAPDFDQTETYKDNTTNVNASGGYHLGTGAISCTWGSAGGADSFVAVRLVAAGGGGGGAAPVVAHTTELVRPFSHAVSSPRGRM